MGSKLFPQNNNDGNTIDQDKFKSIKSEYFSIVNQIIRNNYDQAFNEKRINDNMAICLEKKSFNEIYDLNEIENPSYIYWLDYLYHYLSVEQKNEEWANEMIEKLDEEPFLIENKYLSQFFFKEFFIQNEPQCISESKGDELNESNDDIFSNSNSLKVSLNNNNLNMMRNLGGTFGPNSPQSHKEESESDNSSVNDETEKKYKLLRNQVKKYIYVFKEHIIYKDHPINRVIQIFEETWVKQVEKKLQFIENFNDRDNDFHNTNELIDKLTKQLQDFVIIMQICLKLFYCKVIDYSCFINEKDELINLLTTIIFRTGKIYQTIFKLQKIRLGSIVSDMKNKYIQLKKITPQVLGIEKQFCLNIETLNMQEEILEKEKSSYEKESNKDEKEKDDSMNINTNICLDNKDKGNIYIDITDEKMEIRKINNLLMKIKEKKNKISKYRESDMNDIQVDIDFGSDNNNIISESHYNRPVSLYEDTLVGSLLSKSRETIDNDYNSLNKNNTKNKLNNIFINGNINDTVDENDNCQIIRDHNEARKSITQINFVKVFERISFTKDPEKKEFSYFPYETAIQLLKQIEKYKAPFEKMLIFASLSNEIKNCIDDYWKDMEDYIKNDLLGVEAEQLMTIFVYIISKAQIEDILVHCKLIKLFTTTMTKSSMIGYYYSNAEASVNYIQTLKSVKELFKGSGIWSSQNSSYNDDDD